LLNLFSETESRDELGIGQVRDAFSDLLFPGTSTLHTRARYLIIVPWCFQKAEGRDAGGARQQAQVEKNERIVVGHLKQAGVTDGLIGRLVGAAVKTLPSSIYWTALATYGIRLGEQRPRTLSTHITGVESEELADRATSMWNPTLPAIPDGFPHYIPGGLDLDRGEAEWLRDRTVDGAPETLLARVLAGGRHPSEDSWAPWADPASAHAIPDVTTSLRHAELFSLATHGAALVYNLLIAERYEANTLTRVTTPVDMLALLRRNGVTAEDAVATALVLSPPPLDRAVPDPPLIAGGGVTGTVDLTVFPARHAERCSAGKVP
jgi:hypothetical protein